MGQGYLADTNTIIDYLENKLPKTSIAFIDNIIIQMSVISRMELLVWKKASDEQLRTLNDFINSCTVFNLSENVVIKAIEVRKNHQLKLPDAIIAATAVVYDLVLLTRNNSDFKHVITLKYIDP